MKASAAVFFTLLSMMATPVVAQDHAEIVARVKTEMGPAAFVSNDAMLGFVMHVLAELPPAEGAGLVRGPQGGENIAWYAPASAWVRTNRVIYPGGQIIKILTDSGVGGTNGPAWNTDDVRPDLYVPVTFALPSPPAPSPVPQPVPQPQPMPTPTIDYSDLLQEILDAQAQQIQGQLDLLAIAQDTNTHVKSMDKTIGETLGNFSKFAAKYIAPAIAGWIAAKQLDTQK